MHDTSQPHPFVPDNSDGRISELLFDTTVVHPLPGPNCKHKPFLIEAKQNLRAAVKACTRKKKKYDACHMRTERSQVPTNHF